MRIEILSDTEDDLIAGARFYERQGVGLGEYFLDSLYSDIDSLLVFKHLNPTLVIELALYVTFPEQGPKVRPL